MDEELRRLCKEERHNAYVSGLYYCHECGSVMFFEDEVRQDTLICPKCLHECDIEDYGFEGEDYDDIYN